jgi:hypothetical protein
MECWLMPALVTAVSAAWTAFTATVVVGAVTIGTILKAGAVIYGMVESQRKRQEARSAYNASLRDRTVTIRSSEASRRHAYGRVRIGGVIVYGCNSGARKEYLHLVVALTGHEMSSIDDVWLGDRSIGALDVNGYVLAGSIASKRDKFSPKTLSITVPGFPSQYNLGPNNGVQSIVFSDSEDYQQVSHSLAGSTITFNEGIGRQVTITYLAQDAEPRLQIKKFLGAPARDIELETFSGGDWTVSDVGYGIARIRASFKPDLDVFPQGLQNISVIGNGKAIYDPRTALTVYSDNVALMVLDWLMAPHGFKATLSEIDIPSFIAAANICDELVPIAGGGTQKRYIGGGVIGEDADRKEVLIGLLSAMAGQAVQVAGKWYVKAGAYYPPEITLTDSDFAGGQVNIVANAPRRILFNGVKGRFVDPSNNWAFTDFPPYLSSTYATDDGGEEIVTDIDLPFTNDPIRAQRIAKLQLFRARQSLTIAANFKLKALAITPLTTLRIKNTEFGWDTIDGGLGKLFTVSNRDFDPSTMTVSLTLQEEAPAVYAWDFNEATDPDPAPNTNLKDPRLIDAIDGLTVTSNANTFKKLKDGTIVPYLLVTWTAVTDSLVTEGGSIHVAWKRANEAVYQSILLDGDATSFSIDGVGPGEIINVSIRAINGAQVSSEWRHVTHSASALLATNSQSPRFGLGVNQLENACLKAGVNGWSVFSSPGYTSTIAHVINADGAPTPFGSVAIVCQGPVSTSPAGSLFAVGLKIPVNPGQRIEAQGKVQNFRGNVRLEVIFYDAAGSQVSFVPLAGVIETNSDSLFFTRSLIDFKYLWGLLTVPPGATQAMLHFTVTRTSSSADTLVFVTQPYLGVAHENQTQPSPWTDGPPRGALAQADIATTSLIAPNAATDVLEAFGGAGSGVTGAGANNFYLQTLVVSNPTQQSIVVIATASLQATGQAGVGALGSTSGVSAYILQDGESVLPAGEPAQGFDLNVNQTFGMTLSPTRRFSIAPGATRTYTIGLSVGPDTAYTYQKQKIRVELIKR